MITPAFHLAQTATHLTITAICPSITTSDIEIHTQDTHFSLHTPPYFLRLSLPGPCHEDDDSSARYDQLTGALIVSLTKLNPGDDFVGLDDTERLLRTDQIKNIELSDEQMGVSVPEGMRDERMDALVKERKILLEAEANSWLLPQTVPSATSTAPAEPVSNLPTYPYGFLSRRSGLIHPQPPSLPVDLIHLGPSSNPNVESTTPADRLRFAEEAEDDKFDPGYYQGDFVYDEEIGEILRWEAPLSAELKTGRTKTVANDEEYFTEEEQKELAALPASSVDPTTPLPSLTHPLAILLLSTAYDTRQTLSDPTLESPWTLTALTPLFTSLTSGTSYPTLYAVLRSAYRRMLAFPLYRHWALADRVREDAADVLEGGRRSTLRALLGMKRVLEGGDEGYEVWVKSWVGEMCAWVRDEASDATLFLLSHQLRSEPFTKEDTHWPLGALEAETREGEGDVDLD